MALEGHLRSISSAVSTLEQWTTQHEDLKRTVKPAPKHLAALQGALAGHLGTVARHAPQRLRTSLDRLTRALETLQRNGQENLPAYRDATDCLAVYLIMQENRSARDFAGGPQGQVLRRALGLQWAPAGWSASAVDATEEFDGETHVGRALNIALRWNTSGGFGEADRYKKMPKTTPEERRLSERWVVYEAHAPLGVRAFFGHDRQDQRWALIAFIPNHVAAGTDGTYTQVYNERYILRALRTLSKPPPAR